MGIATTLSIGIHIEIALPKCLFDFKLKFPNIRRRNSKREKEIYKFCKFI
jgi:hypothetical protein